ncbi:MAG: dynamin family protein [Lachnospiraceae bacterium]|nr:dynamin family protein [Lachnospiraceae bacterium]
MQYKQEFIQKFETLKIIKEKYGLDSKDVDEAIESIDTYKVTAPVVGNFSTGKSSLINAVIGKPLLGVEITPETAVPTEVYYGNNKVYRHTNKGIIEYKIEDLPLRDLTVKDTELLRVEYDSEFLKQISTVSIVDLPGFDTSIELHNRAIDQYLPKSLAYLLVVSSDEPVLKESIIDLLKELKTYEIPVYIILTKANRLSVEEIYECKVLLKQVVEGVIGKEVRVACVDSYGDVKIEEFKDILLEIQGKTADIFKQKYSRMLNKCSKYAQIYLLERIEKGSLSISELEQEVEKVEKQIRELSDKVQKEQDTFNAQADSCIQAIVDRVKNNLESNKATISVMLENGADITDKINYIVRNAVSTGIKTEFEPRLQKYVEHISSMVNIEFSEQDAVMLDLKNLTEAKITDNVVKTALPVVLAGVGMAFGPAFALIGGAVGVLGDTIINMKSSVKKKKEIDATATNIINNVSEQSATIVENEIRKYITNVNQQIEIDISRQQEVLEKTLQDIKMDIAVEENSKADTLGDFEKDLNTIKSFAV